MNAIIKTNKEKILEGENTLERVGMLLSFANSNWVTPIYTEVTRWENNTVYVVQS
jgi:hypothetical protein